MFAVRTFRLGDGTSVVAVRGELDDDTAARARDEVRDSLNAGTVIVDLLNVWIASDAALDVLLDTLRREDVTVVADHRLLDRIDIPHGVRLMPSLASALPS
jgi:ABC-type transporter Mla MlaB component